MRIAIIDADVVGRKRHRFPNLACMKLSAYHKELGDSVELRVDYDDLEQYDKVYIAKVFTDTPFPEWVKQCDNVVMRGGTGFFFDKAPTLPYEVEHHYPDYHLYDNWVQAKIDSGTKRVEFKEYLDYSIGYLTRGCFRKCGFCVNQKYNHIFSNSPLEEFYDESRKKICLLDDNFLGFPDWKRLLQQLIDTGKPFKFKQGLDERILTDEKCEMLFSSKYDGDITFAFDKYEDYRIILSKLDMVRRYTDRQLIFYVLCGYDKTGRYDYDFWERDIVETFERIKLLQEYGCLPYIMRFIEYDKSPHRGIYISLARWCNQFSFMKKKSFRDYCENTKGIGAAASRYINEYAANHKDVADKYYDLKWKRWGT